MRGKVKVKNANNSFEKFNFMWKERSGVVAVQEMELSVFKREEVTPC